jgi:hypothetical protein
LALTLSGQTTLKKNINLCPVYERLATGSETIIPIFTRFKQHGSAGILADSAQIEAAISLYDALWLLQPAH